MSSGRTNSYLSRPEESALATRGKAQSSSGSASGYVASSRSLAAFTFSLMLSVLGNVPASPLAVWRFRRPVAGRVSVVDEVS